MRDARDSTEYFFANWPRDVFCGSSRLDPLLESEYFSVTRDGSRKTLAIQNRPRKQLEFSAPLELVAFGITEASGECFSPEAFFVLLAKWCEVLPAS